MTDLELSVIARGLAPVIKDAIALTVDGLTQRLFALEQRAAVPGRDGRDGVPGPSGPPGDKGLDGAVGPTGSAGRDGVDGVIGQIGADGKDGRDGIDGAHGRDGIDGLVGSRGLPGEKGADGLHGRDGAPGAPGAMGAPGEMGAMGPQGLIGLSGDKGVDGRDGIDLNVDDLQAVTYDGERTVTLRFIRGEVVKDWPIAFAVPIYRGVFDVTRTYEAGDLVTYSGSVWIARATTTAARPDEHTVDGQRAWTLAVKRGRDGKVGTPGKSGANGMDGRPGKDFAAPMTGAKW